LWLPVERGLLSWHESGVRGFPADARENRERGGRENGAPTRGKIERQLERMRIGVVSDTHGYFDPRLREVLEGVETIVHAGDLDSPDILKELEQIAPVYAVRGNVDGNELGLPLTRTLHFENVQIEMQHILPAQPSELHAWSDKACAEKPIPKRRDDFLKTFEPKTRVVIFGHSHQPCFIMISQKLFFNPGSAGKKRFSLPRCCGLLEISSMEIKAIIVSLEDGEKNLPAAVVLSFQN
jgi:uncharacterized protein